MDSLSQTSVVDYPIKPPVIYAYIQGLEGISIFPGQKNSVDPSLHNNYVWLNNYIATVKK